MEMTEGQQLGIDQLKSVAKSPHGALEILEVKKWEARSGWIFAHVSIDCSVYLQKPEGLPLRKRERFVIAIPPDFPFGIPEIYTTHARFAGFPHVQWKHYLCLYQAPQTEWDVSDAVLGFLDRLHLWLKQAALGELDPVGAPLHPPVAYVTSDSLPMIIPRTNTPRVPESGWFGLAFLKIISDKRLDIVGWGQNISVDLAEEDSPYAIGAAILLSQEFPFEYPGNCSELIQELEEKGVSRQRLFLALQRAVINNADNTPLYFVLGTPMRGIRGSGDLKQHLTVWRIDPVIAKGLKLAIIRYSENPDLQNIGKEVEKLIIDWTKEAPVEWCAVREDRPEIVIQRDFSSPISWFKSKSVELWGCGALGSHIAEYLVRAGIGKIILRDNGRVAPGVLTRQLFDDADIGRPKAFALADRLKQIAPNITITPIVSNILKEPLGGRSWYESGSDLVIDTTASRIVAQKLELKYRHIQNSSIPLISMMVGHTAEYGFVTATKPGNTGSLSDVRRRAKLAVANKLGGNSFLEEFWPSNENKQFQPEPGCSDPTFIGSAADVAALSGMMLNSAATYLSKETTETAFAQFIAQPHIQLKSNKHILNTAVEWKPDILIEDPNAGYQIRLADSAWNEMEGWIYRAARVSGNQVETGGILFGERDDISKIIWISEVTGPPPDSQASSEYFLSGVEGIAEANNEKRKRTRGSVQFIGMWHTHPQTVPIPSATDMEGMRNIVCATAPPTPTALLLIVGSVMRSRSIGAFVFNRSDFLINEGQEKTVICELPLISTAKRPKNIGLALSGGGARAIAFHLGCLRALHDRQILDQIEVISAVSGGSIIAAMYAYSQDSFAEFEHRVLELLKQGLQSKIAARTFLSKRLFQSLGTIAISGSSALLTNTFKSILKKGISAKNKDLSAKSDRLKKIHPPFRRWVNRTTAFMDVLEQILYKDLHLTDARRNNVEVVINACELRTGTAFRFGSKESGCWRFGKLADNNIKLAQAVAASAAYPALLPALDLDFDFVKNNKTQGERVILTDGGVYDNLGVTCLEPGRSSKFSSNVYNPEYIICCNAGPGLMAEFTYPYWWPSRMTRAFESVFRKAQDSAYGRLHNYAETGKLKGFILSYLGQHDRSLPYIPPDLITREQVYEYPTDFAPMSDSDIEKLSLRGEQLTRLLIAQYCPEL